MIANDEEGWEEMLPEKTVEMIKEEKLFQREYQRPEKIGFQIKD
jgi:hypothetical protein